MIHRSALSKLFHNNTTHQRKTNPPKSIFCTQKHLHLVLSITNNNNNRRNTNIIFRICDFDKIMIVFILLFLTYTRIHTETDLYL